MELRVTSQEAAASFDTLLDRVSGGVDVIVIERDGKAVGRLVPMSQASQRDDRLLTPDDIRAVQKAIEAGVS